MIATETIHRYWSLLVGALPDVLVAHCDQELRCRMTAGPLLDDLGLHPDQVVGRELGELVDGETLARIEPVLRRALAGSVAVTTCHWPDHGRALRIEASPYPSADAVEGVFLVVRDVSERWRSELAVVRAETDLSTIFEASPVGHGIVAFGGLFVAVNAALLALTKYTEPELCAMDVHTLLHPHDAPLTFKAFTDVLSGDVARTMIETRLVDADGVSLPIELHVATFERSSASGRLLLQVVPRP